MAQTAIIVPLLEAEPLIGPFRRQHTDEGAEDMPTHVTLLYPFTDTSLLDAYRIREVANVIGGFEAFDFSLAAALRFPENARVLYLRPEPDAPFRAMTQALVAAFPEHLPYGGKYADPIPHATVAIADQPILAEIQQTIAGSLPIAGRATEAWLSEHDDANGVWLVRERLPLA